MTVTSVRQPFVEATIDYPGGEQERFLFEIVFEDGAWRLRDVSWNW
jgi:hypothetical protein